MIHSPCSRLALGGKLAETLVYDRKAHMEITLEVPETVAKALGYVRETLPRRALEALLIDECARGRLSRGKVAELLGLSFHETEDLFRAHRVPYPIKTSADDALDNAPLPRRP
jgi:predicted HTH domain antitoxin